MFYAGLRISKALNIKMGYFQEIDDKIYKIKIIGKGIDSSLHI